MILKILAIFLQKAMVLIHFTRFSIWNWDMNLDSKELDIWPPCQHEKKKSYMDVKFPAEVVYNYEFSVMHLQESPQKRIKDIM